MATSTSGFGMQLDTGSSYLIKPKTMTIPFDSFDVQVEFTSGFRLSQEKWNGPGGADGSTKDV